MVTPGGFWRKFMETTGLLSKTCFLCLTSQRPPDSGTISYQESILLSDHRLLRQRGTHDKYVSTRKCFHSNWSAAAVTSHKLLLSAESVFSEV